MRNKLLRAGDSNNEDTDWYTTEVLQPEHGLLCELILNLCTRHLKFFK